MNRSEVGWCRVKRVFARKIWVLQDVLKNQIRYRRRYFQCMATYFRTSGRCLRFGLGFFLLASVLAAALRRLVRRSSMVENGNETDDVCSLTNCFSFLSRVALILPFIVIPTTNVYQPPTVVCQFFFPLLPCVWSQQHPRCVEVTGYWLPAVAYALCFLTLPAPSTSYC